MLQRLLVYNKADCYAFIKGLGKTNQWHCKYSIFRLKDSVSVSGVLMNFVLIEIVELNMAKCKLQNVNLMMKNVI